MSKAPTIVWLRRDLRLDDHPTLAAAARRGAVVPVYVLEEGLGGASRWWLHQSLARLQADFESVGSRLILRRGDAQKELEAARRECGADEILSPASPTLFDPDVIATKSGTPYKVFTPYYRACLAHGVAERCIARPKRLAPPDTWPQSLTLDELELMPKIPWYRRMAEFWEPGEAGARARLSEFEAGQYEKSRDVPSLDGTSRLSPHLAFGEISARRVWHTLAETKNAAPYLRQIVWRDFAYNLLHHFPHTVSEPLRPEFKEFPWQGTDESLAAWKKGKTGYPLVDAGMRQLWALGWMHNRVRMVVASFLVKHLLIDWRVGAAWFWDTLVDADLANNTMGWQWTAGCGADAAPFDRVFNPTLQGERFDPDEAYVRQWVPEYGTSKYPQPIVEHKRARERALLAFDKMRAKAKA